MPDPKEFGHSADRTAGGTPTPEVEATVLWHCSYWDGPTNGVCLVDGRVCWFALVGDGYEDERTYLLYDLTDEEVRMLVTSHFLFEQYVGIHTCNHASLDGKRPVGSVRPQTEWPKFYENRGMDPIVDLTNKEPFGVMA